MNLVEVQNQTVITSSLIISQAFEKRHDHVIRDIESLISQNLNLGSDCFHKDFYKAGTERNFTLSRSLIDESNFGLVDFLPLINYNKRVAKIRR